MSRYFQNLISAVPSALLGVLCGLFSIGILTSLFVFVFSGSYQMAAAFGKMHSIDLLIYGLIGTMAYGLPAYSVFLNVNKANYVTAALIWSVPTLLIWIVSDDVVFAMGVLIQGSPIAIWTHFFYKKTSGYLSHAYR